MLKNLNSHVKMLLCVLSLVTISQIGKAACPFEGLRTIIVYKSMSFSSYGTPNGRTSDPKIQVI